MHTVHDQPNVRSKANQGGFLFLCTDWGKAPLNQRFYFLNKIRVLTPNNVYVLSSLHAEIKLLQEMDVNLIEKSKYSFGLSFQTKISLMLDLVRMSTSIHLRFRGY